MSTVWEVSQQLNESKTPFVFITMISGRGHTPQDPGAKAIVTEQGLQFGTVGGGKVEAKAIAFAQEFLKTAKQPEIIVWNLQTDVGMTCGGEVTLLFEAFLNNPWKIAVFGAGHISQALVRVLANLDCQVLCIDPRAEWTEKFPPLKNVKVLQSNEAVQIVPSLKDYYFVCMTQGHASDVPILEAIFRHHPENKFVGVIGSDLKGARIRKDLLERGISASLIEKLRCPIGLPLGTNHPYEIAISISAQLLQTRDKNCLS